MREIYDLALEAAEADEGISCFKRVGADGVVRTDIVIDGSGEERTGKGAGRYITFEFKSGKRKNKEYCSKILSKALGELIEGKDKRERSKILIVGLGNELMTADSLGVASAREVLVTGEDSGLKQKIYKLIPCVEGVTGIESEKVINGVCGQLEPDLIICIDALSATSPERIGNVIQLTDTGISPGSGSGNVKRSVLNEKSMKVPVIAIGIPTVVKAKIIAEKLVDELAEKKMIIKTEKYERYNCELPLIGADLVVTARDIDRVVAEGAHIISSAINMALLRADYFELLKIKK